MHCYFYYVHLLLIQESHSLKTSAELFRFVLQLILLEFLYLLRAVKPCLKKVCKYVFCITVILTALIFFFTISPPLLEAILGYFLVSFVVFFLYFLRTVWFLMKFCTYILDNTLMAVIRKDFMWRLPFAWGLFEFSFFGGREQIFSIFLYFIVFFSWYYSHRK